ncbi:MAG: hypothetical protein A3J74_05780 [Elusimicrobia bacterium RIFCSPHIGHO2_02_FULL_57_9]|nr:MAG: hypothetical protein A3J74_05780 [Elusimicrobia bacterium RIFCSPHIGHO2_02_FULL_57_9]
MIRSFGPQRPRIHKSAFIHDSAEIIGRVSIGKNVSVWPLAVLRGDVDRIRVGERSNIQDGVIVHCREGLPAVIGRGVTVGHGAVVHGARIADQCLVGMGAIVMEASIGRQCLIAAGTLVPKGFCAAARSLIMGVPAKIIRPLKPQELRVLAQSEKSYFRLAQRHRGGSRVLY